MSSYFSKRSFHGTRLSKGVTVKKDQSTWNNDRLHRDQITGSLIFFRMEMPDGFYSAHKLDGALNKMAAVGGYQIFFLWKSGINLLWWYEFVLNTQIKQSDYCKVYVLDELGILNLYLETWCSSTTLYRLMVHYYTEWNRFYYHVNLLPLLNTYNH